MSTSFNPGARFRRMNHFSRAAQSFIIPVMMTGRFAA